MSLSLSPFGIEQQSKSLGLLLELGTVELTPAFERARFEDQNGVCSGELYTFFDFSGKTKFLSFTGPAESLEDFAALYFKQITKA